MASELVGSELVGSELVGSELIGSELVGGAGVCDGLTIGQAATLAGVSVRTLHHWDAIGLVRPSERTSGATGSTRQETSPVSTGS